jgi:KDO2-lipid IV(A) lauroyltransferase
LKNVLEYILFISFSRFFRVFGVGFARIFSFPLAAVFYYIIPIRKETVIANLKIAFPGYSEKEIKKTAFNCYRSFAVTLIEILCFPGISKKKSAEIVKFNNLERVKERYAEKNGVIFLTAHFGNWELEGGVFNYLTGIPLAGIAKHQRNPYVTKWLHNARESLGIKVVYMGVSIRNIYAILKSGGIVALVGDQRADKDSIRVDFFGRSTTVYTGPAVLALKLKAPIFMMIPVRQKDYTYIVDAVEINFDNLPDNEEDQIKEISQRHTKYLEDIIRKNPEQWLWMHKRWKY